MKALTNFIKNIPPLYIFLSKAGTLLMIWLLIETYLNDALTKYFHHPLTEVVVGQSVQVLDLLGLDARAYNHFVLIDNIRAVLVDHSCNGLVIFLLFASFILITNTGTIKKKIVFTLIGLLLVHVTNVIRVTLLAYHYVQSPETFDFNHKYTYTVLVYAVVGLLWWFWIKEKNDTKEAESV